MRGLGQRRASAIGKHIGRASHIERLHDVVDHDPHLLMPV
jgi:hypothetical protein